MQIIAPFTYPITLTRHDHDDYFNNGKYKSILAAEAGELAEIAETVQKDKDFRPHFHIAPPTGLMNDPNGLIFDGEKYHLFYQWFPFDAIHGMKHWKHLITERFPTLSISR